MGTSHMNLRDNSKSCRVGRGLIFWFLVSVQNKFRLTRMSSLVLAGQPRSLPSSERPRASSGAGVQELGGRNMYHYFCSFFGFWFRCKIFRLTRKKNTNVGTTMNHRIRFLIG